MAAIPVRKFDAVIVGAGGSGLRASLELAEARGELRRQVQNRDRDPSTSSDEPLRDSRSTSEEPEAHDGHREPLERPRGRNH